MDDELAELFLAEEPITPEALAAAIRRATLGLRFQPVFMGSAFKNKGGWGASYTMVGVVGRGGGSGRVLGRGVVSWMVLWAAPSKTRLGEGGGRQKQAGACRVQACWGGGAGGCRIGGLEARRLLGRV